MARLLLLQSEKGVLTDKWIVCQSHLAASSSNSDMLRAFHFRKRSCGQATADANSQLPTNLSETILIRDNVLTGLNDPDKLRSRS